MKINCVWEHNGSDSILYAERFVGAYTRGRTPEEAVRKMHDEVKAYLNWKGMSSAGPFDVEIIQEKESDLMISDADSDVIFEREREQLELAEYLELKELALKSAQDFLKLYEAVPDKNASCLPSRTTFYGQVPRTAAEMYQHTKNVNAYYFGEIGVDADNEGSIVACRLRGFDRLEQQAGFPANIVVAGSYDEEWSLRKVLRRFVWHDRIHAKAMYRMAEKTFGPGAVPNVFCFEG